MCNAHDIEQRQILYATFNLADVSYMHIAELCKLFLREFFVVTHLADGRTKAMQNYVLAWRFGG